MNTILEALSRVTRREDLPRPLAASVMRELMTGEATPAQVGALLAGLRTKGETIEEISGFAETMRELATPIHTRRHPIVDTCGTGGDHSGTFNISTTSAFVVAGAGVAVAKHGNRSASSICGSADVLEALGVNLSATAEQVGQCIDEIGIGFLFARSLHTAMKHVAPIRAELKVRTVFNLLGPLTNPARADAQVVGVFDANLAAPLAQVLLNLGVRHAFVVAGADGLDEITLSGPTTVAEARDGAVETYIVEPAIFGCDTAPKSVLIGGDAAANAAILRGVLEGKPGPHRDVVLMNAAAALVAAASAESLQDGFEKAAAAIDSGAALAKLEHLARLTNEMGAGA
ncbi:MAG: hypothetical protein RLZZ303_2815 [Candidatus Hydrogenedentota bacterium]|jgi:anthranilate phosphoribosyltransferase